MLGSGYLPSGSGPTARSMTARVSNDEAVRSAQAPPPQRDCESPPGVGDVQDDDPDRASRPSGEHRPMHPMWPRMPNTGHR
jgi:hypothetical protein